MANTLKFGNGEWYGKKDTILAYNDENSNYKPLPFDFSRGSTPTGSKATTINKDGLIEEVGNNIPRIDYKDDSKGALLLEPSRTNLITYSSDFPNPYWTKSGASIQGDPSTQGSELITNGDFATDSDWTKGTGWTISGGTANCDGTNSPLDQFSLTTIGKTYKVEITVSNMTTASVNVRLGTASSDIIGSILSNGTYTFYGTVANNTTFRIRSSTGFNGSIDNVSVKEVQGFTSPDGTNNAYKLVEDTSNGNHSISATVLVNSGDNSFSMYVKENGRKHISLYTNSRGSENDQYGFYLNGSGSVTFNNTNGDATITSLSNGWYRVSITHPSSGYNTRFFKLYLSNSEVSSNTIPSYQGDGLKGVYIYGSQVEAGSYSTSAISTSGSAVTRLADSCSQTVPDGVIGQTEGTMYAEYYFDATIDNTGGSDRNILEIRDVSSSDRIQMVHYGNGAGSAYKKVYCYAVVASSYVVTIISGVYDSGTMKVAIGYKNNDYVLYVNGVQIGTDTSAGVPSCSKIYLQPQSGTLTTTKTSDVQIYNTRLSNSELAALTQV